MGQAEAEATIAESRAAYEAANGKPPYHVWYDRGWVRFRTDPHGYTHKKRRKEIEAMAATLRARAASHA